MPECSEGKIWKLGQTAGFPYLYDWDAVESLPRGNWHPAVPTGEVERLRAELGEAKELVNIVLSGLSWTGDGYEWTGGEYDYRLKPDEAVAAMKRDRDKWKAENAALRQQIEECKPKLRHLPDCQCMECAPLPQQNGGE
jgi:hypothetical protein